MESSLLYSVAHQNVVRQVAATPDGIRAASSAFDGLFRLWDLATGEELHRWQGGNLNSAVAASPDGTCLAGGNAEGEIVVWNLDNFAERWGRLTRQGNVYHLDFSADGRLLASANHNGTVSLWDAATGANLAHLAGHTGRVWGVAFSPDGAILASGAEDSAILLRETATRKVIRSLRGHRGQVSALAFSPDGRWLASGEVSETATGSKANSKAGKSDHIILWDAAAGTELLRIPAPLTHALIYTADGERLVSGDRFGKVHFWDADSGKKLHTIAAHEGAVFGLALSPDGTRLVTASEDSSASVWQIALTPASATVRKKRAATVHVKPPEKDETQAEFVRLHAEMADLAPDSPEHRKKEKAAQALLDQHEDRWTAELREYVEQWAFEGGEITHVVLSASRFLAHAEHIFRLAPIASVALKDVEAVLERLARCPDLARLTRLEIQRQPQEAPLSPETLRAILGAPLDALTSLALPHCRLGAAGVRELLDLPILPKLTSLALKLNALGDEGVALLAESPHLGALTSLDLTGNAIGDRGASALAASPHLSGLTSLTLLVNQIGDEGAMALAESKTLGSLTTLVLGSNQLGEAAASALAEPTALPNLTHLDVTSNPFPRTAYAPLRARYGRGLQF
jgi:WD40 repeat protein